MASSDNFYSRLVAWMKIILPLAALALLSTIFLISQHIDPTKSVTITEIDLAQRAQDQGATNASFAGVTSSGDEIIVTAITARPSPDIPRLILAEEMTAQLKLLSGAVIDVVSDHGTMHQNDLTASLQGNVVITTTTGYDIQTERLNARIDELYAESPGQVTGRGPPGDLEAGRMVLTHNEETNVSDLVFTDGVKLVYTPQPSEED